MSKTASNLAPDNNAVTWWHEETQAPGRTEQAALDQEISKNALQPPRIIVQNGKILDRARFKALGLSRRELAKPKEQA